MLSAAYIDPAESEFLAIKIDQLQSYQYLLGAIYITGGEKFLTNWFSPISSNKMCTHVPPMACGVHRKEFLEIKKEPQLFCDVENEHQALK